MNKDKHRPLSPHLSIYKLQLTSGLSILHRITGAYLYCGIIILAWTIFSYTYFPFYSSQLSYVVSHNSFFLLIFKTAVFFWAFAIFYHMLNGIRHLFWDIGKGFDLKTTYFSGKLVLSLAFFLTLVTWLLA